MITRTRVVLASVLAATVVATVAIVAVGAFLFIRQRDAAPYTVTQNGTGDIIPVPGTLITLRLDYTITNRGDVPMRAYYLRHGKFSRSAGFWLSWADASFLIPAGESAAIQVTGGGTCPFAPPAEFGLEFEVSIDGADRVQEIIEAGPIPGEIARQAQAVCALPPGSTSKDAADVLGLD